MPFVLGTQTGLIYVSPGDTGGTMAIADVGNTTVFITGPFTKNQATEVFSHLESF
jgi:hypothetical protein